MRAPWSRFGLGSLLVALLVLLAATPALAGSIVPGVSIDGVRIGQSADQVKRILGAPPHTAKGRAGFVRWDYTAHDHLTVDLVNGKVVSVSVSMVPGQGRALDHTTEGIGLLSQMSAANKAYPGQCQPPDPAVGNPPGCGFQNYWTTRMGFAASGRYGIGWKAPIETISLELITVASRKEILQRLEELHAQGAMSDQEYATKKADVLATM
jgi:hypothetical protein